MISFFVLVLLIVLIVAVSQSSNSSSQRDIDEAVKNRDRQWRAYISAFSERVKSEAESQLISRILTGDTIKQRDQEVEANKDSADEQAPISYDSNTQVAPSTVHLTTESPAVVATKKPIDNALLLLYFGAFLFVASVGLFVAFADMTGATRTVLVALLAISLYGIGLWLHRTSKRLQQAGIAFTAIGMAIAPLVGLAAYTYVFNQSSGPIIWFTTSVIVLAMYGFALYKIRTTFMGYLFIFSFLSLAQSAMSIFEVPLHFFIWTLIISGMALRVLALRLQSFAELQEPADASAQVIVPLSIFVSFLVVSGEGFAQLAITLFFASAFYGFEAYLQQNRRVAFISTAHLLGLAGIAVGAFSFSQSITHVTISLLVASVFHIAVLLRLHNGAIGESVGTNALALAVLTSLTALNDPVYLLLGLLSMLLLGSFISYKQKRTDALLVGLSSFIFIPLVVGQGVLEPNLGASGQAVLSMVPVGLVAVLRYMLHKHKPGWLSSTSFLFVLLTLMALGSILFSSTLVSLALTITVGVIYILLSVGEEKDNWAVGSGFIMLTFALKAIALGTNPVLTMAFLLVVIWNIALALHFRKEATRWLGSIHWFLLPVVLGVGDYFYTFTAAWYAWLYIGVMIGFLFARAIARGALAPSTKAPLSSYEKSASSVYMIGYGVSGAVATLIALGAQNAQLHASLIVVFLIGTVYITSVFIEKSRDMLSLIPLLLQLLLFTSLQPITATDNTIQLFLGLSIAVAVVAYLPVLQFTRLESLKDNEAWRLAAKVTLFAAPFSVFLFGQTYLLMPIGLAIAGGFVLYESWKKDQSSREVSSLLLVLALIWLMYHFGVRNIQAYTHVIAAIFAAFAYWRYRLGQQNKTDDYLKNMFLVATIPLVLQALFGRSGDIYGWWLILEQVGFILLGVGLGRRYLTVWGLYVSVAAVLYQLRDLGWAALTVLAVFIISMALYHLNKQNTQDDNKT